MTDDQQTIQQLRQQIDDLTQAMNRLQRRVGLLDGPHQRVFVAEKTGEKTWTEKSIAGGSVGDFPDGRRCDSDTDDAALVDREENTTVLLAVEAGDKERYVEIAGTGAGIPPPTKKYQVFTPIDDTLVPIWTSARFMEPE